MHKIKWSTVKNSISKHSPQILTVMAIAEFAATVYLVAKAVPKAEKLKKEAEAKKGEELTLVEKAKTTWKCYIPAGIVGACTVASIIGVNTVSAKRNLALATAYQATETALRDYKAKVVETVGEKKEAQIQDAVAQDYINRTPFKESQIINTGQGTTLFRDWASGRDFLHDRVKIEQACNRLNHRMLTDEYVSLNDFFYEIGLDGTGVGDELGWNINREGLIEAKFSPCEVSNGEPGFLIHFAIGPVYGYRW